MSGKTVLEIEGLKVALPKGADRPCLLYTSDAADE